MRLVDPHTQIDITAMHDGRVSIAVAPATAEEYNSRYIDREMAIAAARALLEAAGVIPHGDDAPGDDWHERIMEKRPFIGPILCPHEEGLTIFTCAHPNCVRSCARARSIQGVERDQAR